MFKFGRPNKLYDKNLVQDFVQNYFITGQTFVSGATYPSGMTMNYMISVDPAVPANNPDTIDRYSRKIVNPNYYGTFEHNGDIRWEDEL